MGHKINKQKKHKKTSRLRIQLSTTSGRLWSLTLSSACWFQMHHTAQSISTSLDGRGQVPTLYISKMWTSLVNPSFLYIKRGLEGCSIHELFKLMSTHVLLNILICHTNCIYHQPIILVDANCCRNSQSEWCGSWSDGIFLAIWSGSTLFEW